MHNDEDNILTFIPDEGEEQPNEPIKGPSGAGEDKGLQVQPSADQNGLEGPPDGAILQEMDRLKSEVDDLRELYLRKLAEFDNFRKRVDREKEEFRKLATEDLIRDLVPVLDNFTRALSHEGETDLESFRKGIELIARQLKDALERQGLQEIDPLGEHFNPEFHDAVQRVEDPSREPGTVVSVLARGYTLGGRLLRPAMVAVAVEPSDGSGAARELESSGGEG